MNDTERFPKPDVPWFGDLYGRAEWSLGVVGGRPAEWNGWQASADLAQGRATCDEPDPDPRRIAAACRLPAGHDGPHLSIEADGERSGRLIFTSLRHVAQPAQVSS